MELDKMEIHQNSLCIQNSDRSFERNFLFSIHTKIFSKNKFSTENNELNYN